MSFYYDETMRMLGKRALLQNDLPQPKKSVNGNIKDSFFNKVEQGDLTELSQILCRYKEILNSQNNTGKTALHLAATYSHPHIITALLSHRAAIDLVDEHGFTALYYAHLNRQQPGMRLMVKKMYESKYGIKS